MARAKSDPKSNAKATAPEVELRDDLVLIFKKARESGVTSLDGFRLNGVRFTLSEFDPGIEDACVRYCLKVILPSALSELRNDYQYGGLEVQSKAENTQDWSTIGYDGRWVPDPVGEPDEDHALRLEYNNEKSMALRRVETFLSSGGMLHEQLGSAAVIAGYEDREKVFIGGIVALTPSRLAQRLFEESLGCAAQDTAEVNVPALTRRAQEILHQLQRAGVDPIETAKKIKVEFRCKQSYAERVERELRIRGQITSLSKHGKTLTFWDAENLERLVALLEAELEHALGSPKSPAGSAGVHRS